MNWASYKHQLRKQFWFNKDELTSFIITVIVLALIFSFGEWSKPEQPEVFDLAAGIQNFLLALGIALVSVFIHHAVQRLYAIKNGYTPEHKLWWYGILIGLALAIVTQGKLWFLAATSFTLSASLKLRIGKKYYGENIQDFSKAAFLGIFANLCLAALIKTINDLVITLPEAFVTKMFLFNLAFAFCNFLPIPPLDGCKIFFASRMTYVIEFTFFLTYILLKYVLGYESFIAAFIIATIIWLIYYRYIESEL